MRGNWALLVRSPDWVGHFCMYVCMYVCMSVCRHGNECHAFTTLRDRKHGNPLSHYLTLRHRSIEQRNVVVGGESFEIFENFRRRPRQLDVMDSFGREISVSRWEFFNFMVFWGSQRAPHKHKLGAMIDIAYRYWRLTGKSQSKRYRNAIETL